MSNTNKAAREECVFEFWVLEEGQRDDSTMRIKNNTMPAKSSMFVIRFRISHFCHPHTDISEPRNFCPPPLKWVSFLEF